MSDSKKTMQVSSYIDPKITVGAIVRLTDGSGLSIKEKNIYKDFYIVGSYPEEVGARTKLEDCACEVIETGVTDWVVAGVLNHCYIQDIVVKIGKAEFRTCSAFVELT